MNFKYHFAFSFSRACRDVARSLAKNLRSIGYNVFFDEWFEHEMLGLSGSDYLRHVYARDARHCIVLVDESYDQREWTRFEREIIEARTLQEPKDVMIPVLVDGYHPDWLPSTRIHCDFREKGIEATVALLARKLPLHSDGVAVSFTPHVGFEHDLVISKKSEGKKQRVLIINAGGTIGFFSEHQLQTGKPARWHDLQALLPQISGLKYDVDMVTFSPPIEAANITQEHWRSIANAIEVHYQDYCGFVVLHGSDTLSYTASALSFILVNLSKPVVLTYSQVLPFYARTDALSNILTALEIAASIVTDLPTVPEVSIISGGTLLRGNRATKVSSSRYDAFASPNFPPLGNIGEFIIINTNLILATPFRMEFYADFRMSPGVLVLSLFPGVKVDLLRKVVFDQDEADPKISGVLLEVFGSGNIPSDRNFMAFINECRGRRIPIVISSRLEGGLLGLYDSERSVLNAGVIGSIDMTIEAAMYKLSWAIGQNLEYEDIGVFMQKNCRGELTEGLYERDRPTRLIQPTQKGRAAD